MRLLPFPGGGLGDFSRFLAAMSLLALGLSGLLPSCASASVLAMHRAPSGRLVGEGASPDGFFYLSVFSEDQILPFELFEQVSAPANVGRTVWLSGDSDDPDFGGVVDLLTNGRSDSVIEGFCFREGGSGVGGSESYFWGLESVDLLGYAIDRIGIQVDSVTMTLVGYDYYAQYDVTYLIEGNPVPEPSAVFALLFGVSGTGAVAWRRNSA